MNRAVIEKAVMDAVEQYIRPEGDMTLAAALRLSEKVLKKAAELKVKAVAAVTDRAGNPVSVQVSDGAFPASYDIALHKAYTSAALRMSTKELSLLAAPGGSLYGIQFTNQGKIVIFGGGDPLKDKNGEVIGGIGVSGGTEEQDTLLSRFGREIFEKGIKQ